MSVEAGRGARIRHRVRGARSRHRVLVVGAGPAGSSVALRLAGAGVPVTLLDAASFPRSKPCGDCLSPGATPLLEELGVLERVERRAGRLAGWRIRSAGGEEAVGRFRARRPARPIPEVEGRSFGLGTGNANATGVPTPGVPTQGLSLPRRELDAILVEAAVAAGAELREGMRVFDLLREDGRVVGVRARDASGRERTLEGRVVVGADGLRSTVARRAGGVERGRRRKLGLVGRYAGVRPPSGGEPLGEMRLGEQGCLGLAPLGRGRWNATLVVPLSEAPAVGTDREAFFRSALERYGVAERFRGAERLGPLEITGPFEVTPRRTTVPGALLAGDAAGYVDPLTGQGVHAALSAGRAAARAVSEMLAASSAGAEAAARRRYARELRRRRGPVHALQRGIDALAARPVLMDRAVALLRGRPGLADLLIDVTGDRLPVRTLARPTVLARALRVRTPTRSTPAPTDRPCTHTTRS